MIFDEAYAQAVSVPKQKISALLGNGFSMAYDAKRFSFTNLLQSAQAQNIISPNSELAAIFRRLQTSDFEQVIKTLNDAKLVTNAYFPYYDTKKLEKDAKLLKKHLVKVVTNNHPEKANEIPEAASKHCGQFLDKFEKIYTLNYDLLAYWVIMQNHLTKFTDGFGGGNDNYVVFQENSHELLFLHGALHIFDNLTETVKLTFSRTGTVLKMQIYRNLLNNIYPVFISEGTSEEKLRKIRHNYYLNRCYKSLRSQSGTLFIFGTMLKSNDEHIKRGIIEGKFNTLYIGVWSDADRAVANMLKDEFESSGSEKHPRQAYLYDSKTVKPWG